MPLPFFQSFNGFKNEAERNQFILDLNKIELHVHIEATMSGELILKLANSQMKELSTDLFGKEGNVTCTDFASFCQAYDEISALVCTEEALQEVVYDYLMGSAQIGVKYVEITLSPQHMARFGVSYEATIAASVAGLKQAQKECDIDACFLIVLVRHQDIKSETTTSPKAAAAAAEALVKLVINNPNEYVVGISLAGDEAGFPICHFKAAFEMAKQAGLAITAHAGEFADHSEIQAAVEMGITRIGHGIHAAFDEATLKLLVDKNIHLEICPSSNARLMPASNYPKDYQHLQHALTILHPKGVNYSLNTDDPTFFTDKHGKPVTLLTEIKAACELIPALDATALIAIQRNAIHASFAPEQVKTALLEELDKFKDRWIIKEIEIAMSEPMSP